MNTHEPYDDKTDKFAPAPRDRTEPSKSSEKTIYSKQIVISKEPYGFTVIPYNKEGKIAGSGLLHFTEETYDKAISIANHLSRRYNWPIVDLIKAPSMKTEKQKFQSLVRECINEVKMESNPRTRLKESLRKVVKRVLNEISSIKIKPIDEDKAEKDRISKGYKYDRQVIYHKGGGPERLDKINTKLQKELETLVHGINSEYNVYIDDYNQLNVDAKNSGRIRIYQKFENNFDVDFMWKLTDRIRAIALTWEQVKEFVKVNLKELEGPEGNKTKADKAWEKSMSHKKDNEVITKDAGPRHDIVKNRLETPEKAKVKDTKRADKDYNEPEVKKEEDMPDQQMKQVTEPGKDPDSKNKNIEKTPQVKPQKHKKDDGADKLKTNLPTTKKFRLRKS